MEVSSKIAHTNFSTVVHVRGRLIIAAILSIGAHTTEPVAISFLECSYFNFFFLLFTLLIFCWEMTTR
jgi:hypothetical protein